MPVPPLPKIATAPSAREVLVRMACTVITLAVTAGVDLTDLWEEALSRAGVVR